MVSKESGKCMLTNSESDSEAAPSTSLALEVKYSLEASRQVRKRNKALQVRFKDICEAQNEQREAELHAAGKGGKPISYKVAYRKYMTVPARRSIPNVTRSTGVQTSPDLKKRYQTFPFERKKGHTLKHVAAVETYKGQNNGFAMEVKQSRAAEQGLDEEEEEEEGGGASRGSGVRRTRALLHTNECIATVEQHTAPDGLCSDALQLSCSADTDCLANTQRGRGAGAQAEYQLCSVPSKARAGLQHREADTNRSAKRQLLNLEEGSSRTLPVRASKVTGPLAWNSLTQVECLDSPSVRSKRKKALQLNGLQSQTLPRSSGGCTTQAQCHTGQLSARPLRAMEEPLTPCRGGEAGGAPSGQTQETCKQIVPMNQDGEVKAQLQAMEHLISSSQETIKVLLGVIQELEKGEAHREGLSYRTGQDTANCDTCRNSACIIYSVELDFKQQEDKLQPLMMRLFPSADGHFPSLPYPQEAFTSTPKRKVQS
ncbi:inhibitory synaptic factor 2A [Pseudochaenichthys georgianus]|uniref:inhibitory synaptic factor 2A n=1 Tax=Pseudochaenichthys georgianus TaxID=52239 RepID=UPI00146AB461|nr:inhibitory synaptic factor 2A [Pseudochaenichthys georgianus]XP_033962963.1 inhibitory synaptic factor 2A [Pseudochaenichthys georgianus]